MPIKMKTIELFCASPASTAICSSTDPRSILQNTSKPAFNYHHHHRRLLTDQYKKNFSNINKNNNNSKLPPCNISDLPFTPRPKTATTPRRKSSSDIENLAKNRGKCSYGKGSNSSRYLLGDSPFLESSLSCSENKNTPKKCLALVRSEERELTRMVVERENVNNNNQNNNNEIRDNNNIITERKINYGQIIVKQKTDSMSTTTGVKSSSSLIRDQVVVLRVSLHCKGCEGKLRKYLSKMEGVKSFNIDLESKKVTVVGNVTPLSLLTSISKVKYAQLWPYPTSSSSGSLTSSSSNSSSSDFN